ncbi:MAG TPA: hypothetical protein VH518_22660 [Tepidisphaeraceae bacterium]
MLLSVVVLVLVGAVAYWHYVQGFFSATLSAILAILAAVLAFSLHEPIVRSLLGGKMADQAHALVLVALFVIIYTIFRIIFDKAIPGNIRLPVMVDKVGAGAAGVVAGIYAIGILIIAAQLLPFGPSVAGYARYSLNDQQEVRVPSRRGQQIDAYTYDTLKSETINAIDHSGLLIPVDDIVVGTTRALSDGGSLAGPQSLAAVHPSYVDEIFFQRLGMQTGAKRVAYNLDREKQVDLSGIYTLDSIPQADSEPTFIPNRFAKIEPVLKSDSANINLIVRLKFAHNASDSDNYVRVSPAAVRLVANGINYMPVGTISQEEGPIVRVTRPDDYLIVRSDGIADFVFSVPREDFGLQGDPKNKTAALQIGPNVFIEAKRMGVIDLSGQEVKREVPSGENAKDGVLRKPNLTPPKVAPGGGGTAAKESSNSPLEIGKLEVNDQFFVEVNVGGHEGDNADVTFKSGKGKLTDKKLAVLEVEPKQSPSQLQQGDFPVRELWVPGGQKIVQLSGSPGGKGHWDWAEKLGQFELVDDKGQTYKPRGAWTKVKQGRNDRVIAKWDAQNQINDLPHAAEMVPTDVWIAFVIPENTTLKEVRFDGKRIKSVDQQVK